MYTEIKRRFVCSRIQRFRFSTSLMSLRPLHSYCPTGSNLLCFCGIICNILCGKTLGQRVQTDDAFNLLIKRFVLIMKVLNKQTLPHPIPWGSLFYKMQESNNLILSLIFHSKRNLHELDSNRHSVFDYAFVIRLNQDLLDFFVCSSDFLGLACSGLACSGIADFVAFMVCPAGTLFFFFWGMAHCSPALPAAVGGPQPQSGGSITYKNVPLEDRFIG